MSRLFRFSNSVLIVGLPCVFALGVLPRPLLAVEVPKPSPAPVSWELKFDFHDPQRIRLTLPGDDGPTTFWYMLYRVENDTGKDVSFFPTAELVAASLEVVTGGEQISPSVYDAIKSRHRATHPFLIEPRHVTGTLLQGEDNAKTSVVVFRQFNFEDNAFAIYFGGLSGEIRRIPNPSFDMSKPESSTNPRTFNMRKTLEIKYKLPGDVSTRRWADPVRVGREWLMR